MNPVTLVMSRLIGCVMFGCLLALPAGAASPAETNAPLDWRYRLSSSDFQAVTSQEWVSPVVKPPFAYEELIYSWLPERPGDSFRLYLKAVFGPDDASDWLPAGHWGAVQDIVSGRKTPVFDRGVLDMDFLKLKAKAVGFQFKVVSAGDQPLRSPPALSVVITDNHPTTPMPTVVPTNSTQGQGTWVLDVPLRRQLDSRGVWMKDRCQSAALASVLQYYGQTVPLEKIAGLTFDPEYQYPGIWPRVIAAAREFGLQGYIDRFRSWDQVRSVLRSNQLILCSMRLAEGQCQSPPYPSMGNHIVVLCGLTDDGRVVVTDSALGKSGKGYLCQWLQSDFEKVWMQTKGGVGLVFCPPPGARTNRLQHLPAFPQKRTFPEGDDH